MTKKYRIYEVTLRLAAHSHNEVKKILKDKSLEPAVFSIKNL